MTGKRVDWSNLPSELWALIAKHVNSSIDILRFRSVCKTWRSALPLPPSLTLISPRIPILHAGYSLFQTKIYILQPYTSQYPSPSSPSSSNSKAFLIKVGQSKTLQIRLLDPFTNSRLSHTNRIFPSHTSPDHLNFLKFRVIELIEAYTLSFRTRAFYDQDEDEDEDKDVDELRFFMSVPSIRKVMLFPSSHVEGRILFALYNDGKLGVSKIEDENWTILDEGNQLYDDIILYKGQLYVVDKWGTIFWIDCSSFKLVQFSPLLCGFGKRKHLVESAGSLYVVDMYMEYVEVVDIKVYMLDEEWGRWLDVKNLGDVLFVLCKDSNFSLSAQDYYGCEGNCIYFYSEGRASGFCLHNSKFKSPKPFCPCPTLFHPDFNF
ncbi:hypothetical protein VNO77_40528 [Canavalia gladiata]|uniref:F-box domain-containing protein n=1 Tax=Canavalia gladiata TaxID=3824 RepID=A0AAN9JXP4_CANGL